MADAEETQFNSLADRITALNRQKNSALVEPVRKRPPPPPPPVAKARATNPAPATPDASARRPSSVLPPPSAPSNPPPLPRRDTQISVVSGDKTTAIRDNGRPVPPPLPSRAPSSRPSIPQLPRRTSTQSSLVTLRRNSASSDMSQLSSSSSSSSSSLRRLPSSKPSHGSNGSAYQRKLAPALSDPSSLPPLPPSRRESETKAQEATERPTTTLADDDVPPPIPRASRPSAAQIQAASAKAVTRTQTPGDCWVCRDWSGPDRVATQFPRESLPRKDPVGHLARGLCDPFPSYTDKARAIFTWFHHNIHYDTVAFFGNNVRSMSVEQTIFGGRAVCQGYAETYKAIANQAGLDCIMVCGHGKGFGHVPLKKGERPPRAKPDGHAWNAVRIDGGGWKLIDACWGAGHICGDNQLYKQEFSPEQFTSSNEKFGLRHFPQDASHQFRSDGRTVSWEEYFRGPIDGEPPTFYTNGHQEGIAEDSVQPRERDIRVHGGGSVRFQFSKICEHWTPERNGLGKAPLLLLSIHGVDGRKDEMVPMESNGFWHWIDVDARQLGAPGQSVEVAQLTTMNDRDARGVSAAEFLSKRGRVGMSWSYVMKWELV
ncbi:transglutaminase-like superfamily protein [Hirsutella rhossiliensis]|uniref:Transglutaminase-like superfamily domain-containing protein n=1 Tax=Hirsutella rhossiliensis TaxID=111463 RepID=A0A9P8N265_9HYPO|nr:transglutaminase-like superfamily domain-containing protein [Hirsutella rhossiliensis]KAH0965484.1 transglutaminase-like superfamily domain-containing protein [Hirsutella rhossiliensis]